MCVYIHTYIYTYIHIYNTVYTQHMYICIHIIVCIHIYIYIYTHTYIFANRSASRSRSARPAASASEARRTAPSNSNDNSDNSNYDYNHDNDNHDSSTSNTSNMFTNDSNNTNNTNTTNTTSRRHHLRRPEQHQAGQVLHVRLQPGALHGLGLRAHEEHEPRGPAQQAPRHGPGPQHDAVQAPLLEGRQQVERPARLPGQRDPLGARPGDPLPGGQPLRRQGLPDPPAAGRRPRPAVRDSLRGAPRGTCEGMFFASGN